MCVCFQMPAGISLPMRIYIKFIQTPFSTASTCSPEPAFAPPLPPRLIHLLWGMLSMCLPIWGVWTHSLLFFNFSATKSVHRHCGTHVWVWGQRGSYIDRHTAATQRRATGSDLSLAPRPQHLHCPILFPFKLIQIKWKVPFFHGTGTFQEVRSHGWLVAATPDEPTGYFHHHRMFFQTMLD